MQIGKDNLFQLRQKLSKYVNWMPCKRLYVCVVGVWVCVETNKAQDFCQATKQTEACSLKGNLSLTFAK